MTNTLTNTFRFVAGLALTLGMATACGKDGGPTAPSSDTPAISAERGPSVDIQVQSAQVSKDGFCFFVLGDPFGGYSGEGQRVDAASGRTNYHCKADLLFGDPVTRAVHLRDVPFFDFFLGAFDSCDIDIAPGEQAMVQCHQ